MADPLDGEIFGLRCFPVRMEGIDAQARYRERRGLRRKGVGNSSSLLVSASSEATVDVFESSCSSSPATKKEVHMKATVSFAARIKTTLVALAAVAFCVSGYGVDPSSV